MTLMVRSRRPTDGGEEEKKVAEVLELQFPSVSDKCVSLDLYINIKSNLTRLFLLWWQPRTRTLLVAASFKYSPGVDRSPRRFKQKLKVLDS